jgi:hypothetical protein
MVNITDGRGNRFTVPDVVATDYAEQGVEAEPAPADPTPTEKTTNEDIASWAGVHGIDLADATTKAEMLAVIREHTDA